MNLKKIVIKNFKKINNEGVTFEIKPGLNLIKSEINGTGKTTLLSAITFLLWNKNGDTKGNSKTTLSTSELINDVNKKDLLVEGYFDNGYIIRRGLKPNIFEIIDENGNNLADRSSKTIDQDFLENELLGYNYETFMSTIFLNSKPNSIPFIYMSNTQRKEYIEKILDLRVIHFLNENLKNKISSNKNEIIDCTKQLEWNKENLKILSQEFERQIQIRDKQKLEIEQFKQNKETQIQNNINTISILNERINTLISANEILSNNIENNSKTVELEDRIHAIQLDISEIQNNNILPEYLKDSEDNKILIQKEIEDIKNSLAKEFDELNGHKLNLDRITEELQSKDETSLKNNLKLIESRLHDVQNEVMKKQTEKEIHYKNKESYSVCCNCPTLSKIIGMFNDEEYEQFIIKSEDIKNKLNEKYIETEKIIESLSNLKNNINLVKEEISKITTTINNKQNLILTKENIIKDIDYKIKEYELNKNQKIQEKQNEIINLRKDIQTIKEKIILNIENNKNEIIDKTQQIKAINVNIENIKSQEPPTLIIINEQPVIDSKNKILELEGLYDTLNIQKVELEELKASINDKNIKEQALKVYIPLFEEKVNSLISRFTEDDMFTIKAKLTDDFDITFTKNGKSLNMFSLSEGQKASITFAFTFAFHFLLDTKNQIKESTLFIDEILDIALSSGRLNTIIEYLKEVSVNKSVYIISHNPNIQLELFDNIIDVSIENGFSKYKFLNERI